VAASDVRVVDVTGDDVTQVRFDVPCLGDAARELYAQEELFPRRPRPEDTGFDLLGDVLSDVAARNENSDRFDQQLLRGLDSLRHVVDGQYEQILVSGQRYLPERPALVDRDTIVAAASLCAKTPPPVRTRVVGMLDTVRISAQSFGLRLDDGQEIRGFLSGGDFDQVVQLFAAKRPVVVRGNAIFRPSGQLLLVDADDVDAAAGETSLWSRVPQPRGDALEVGRLHRRQGPRSGLGAIIGRWPGDESDEEVAKALGRCHDHERRQLVLLDTNVIVHLARYDATGQAIEEQYALRTRPERPCSRPSSKARYSRWRAGGSGRQADVGAPGQSR